MSETDRMWSTAGAGFLAISLVALWVWPKFVGVDIHPIFGWAEALTGAAWLEPGARLAVGALALVLVVLVIVPRTRVIGSIGAFALSLAFTVAHLTPWLGVDIPAYEPLMAALGEGRTAAEIRAMGLDTDRGAHFSMALVNMGLALMTGVAEKVSRQPKAKPAPMPKFAVNA